MTNSKIFKTLAVSLAVASSFNVQADSFDDIKQKLLGESTKTDYNYVGAKGGVVVPGTTEGNSDLQSVNANTTYTAGVFIGRKFMDRYAIEVEFSKRGKSDINSSNLANDISTNNNWGVSAKTVMLNVSADLLTHETIRPYIKFGAGFSRNKADNYIYSSNNSTTVWNGSTMSDFAWSAGFGLNFATYESIDSFVEYSFINRGKFTTQKGASLTVNGTSFSDPNSSARFGYLREQVVAVGAKYKF